MNCTIRDAALRRGKIIAADDKQMQVVRHNDVSTDSNAVTSLCALSKVNESAMYFLVGENVSAILDTAGYKIHRPRR